MMLEDKVAVIYGAAGSVGSAVANAFAREGARLFLAGRRIEPLRALASKLCLSGVAAEAGQADALDEESVEAHMRKVIDRAGRIDICFNAVGIPNTQLQGVPLVDLPVEQFLRPITTYAQAYFITARLAARRMIEQGSGVIMTVTAVPSRMGIPLTGGIASAFAAVEALSRNLSAELAARSVRVVGLRSPGMVDSATIKEVIDIHSRAYGMPWEQFHQIIAGKAHTGRLQKLAEMAEIAAFMASDRASAMTGTVVNMTMGNLDD